MKALWEVNNLTTLSSVFYVPVGQVALIMVSGLAAERVRKCAKQRVRPQAMCVRRIIYGFDKMPQQPDLSCGRVFDMNEVKVTTLVDDFVRTCGCGGWTLTSCKNLGIIGIPGAYRLELNDSTAVGTAQAYVEFIGVHKVPMQVKNLFFA